jgi:hypothetical protein
MCFAHQQGIIMGSWQFTQTAESKFQHCFSVNMWRGIIGNQLVGPYIFTHHLTSDIYTGFFKTELPALLENILLWTWMQMNYQHDGAPPHFRRNVMQYLNEQFPDQWISHSSMQNWPLWSQAARLSCMGSHETHGVWTQGGHKRRTTSENFWCCKLH